MLLQLVFVEFGNKIVFDKIVIICCTREENTKEVAKYITHKGWNLFYTSSITNKIQSIINSIVINSDFDLYITFPNYNSVALQGNKTLGFFDEAIACNFPIATFINSSEYLVDFIIMYSSYPDSAHQMTILNDSRNSNYDLCANIKIDEFQKLKILTEEILISSIENIKNIMKLIANKKLRRMKTNKIYFR